MGEGALGAVMAGKIACTTPYRMHNVSADASKHLKLSPKFPSFLEDVRLLLLLSLAQENRLVSKITACPADL